MKSDLRTTRLALICIVALSWLTMNACGQAPAPPPPPSKVTVELAVVEIQTSKLRTLGFDWIGIRDGQGSKSLPSPAPEVGQDEGKLFTGSEEFLGLVKALASNNLAKAHAEPVLVTLSGRPASFESGGTRVEVVPIVLGNGRIELDYRLTLPLPREPAASFTCYSAVILEPGKACVITLPMSGPPDAAGKPSETEMLVIARASLGVPEHLSGRGGSAVPNPTQSR